MAADITLILNTLPRLCRVLKMNEAYKIFLIIVVFTPIVLAIYAVLKYMANILGEACVSLYLRSRFVRVVVTRAGMLLFGTLSAFLALVFTLVVPFGGIVGIPVMVYAIFWGIAAPISSDPPATPSHQQQLKIA